MEPLVVTPKQAAQLLALSLPTINRMLADGRLPAVHLGKAVRIPRAVIDRMVHECMDPAS